MIDALLRPALSLLLAVTIPLGTAQLLAWRYLQDLPPGGEDRRRQLAPFRRAAFILGLAQIQLAWMLGVTAFGPPLASSRSGIVALGAGALCAIAAFVAGGIARRVESPPHEPTPLHGAALLRLRLVPWFAGPLIVGFAAAQLPFGGGNGTIRWGFVLLALALCAIGVAYAGLVLSFVTAGVRPATPAVRELGRKAVEGEGLHRRPLVLRLPTHGARLANAAALPWAHTMVVSDAATNLLPSEQLRAVLAHEAGHLSERPAVMWGRLTAATGVLFAVTVGPRLAPGAGPPGTMALVGGLLLVAIGLLLGVRRIARRMEVRADRRAAETVGPIPLAEALRRLHDYAQTPTVSGHRKRTHPDLYDRLVSLGIDPGPRPQPPPRGGLRFGIALALILVGAPIALHMTTDIEHHEVTDTRFDYARNRLFIEPWDADAMLALGWHARRDGDLERARGWARRAAEAGASEASYWELWAELHAAAGDCERARDAFDRSIRARGRAQFEQTVLERDLRLGNYHLPPTLVRECGLSGGSEPSTPPQ